MTCQNHGAIIKVRKKCSRAAGLGLPLCGNRIQMLPNRYQNLIERYLEQCTERIEVVDRREALAALPLIDSARFLKAKEVLQVPYS